MHSKTFVGNNPLDLSSLLYKPRNTSSKAFYGLVLSLSVTSLGISFARLLTQGHKPVIKSILSFQFLKVLMMLIFKFIIQSYILSMAVMSLMYKFVSKFQYFQNPEFDTEDYRKLEDKYWRGLCVPIDPAYYTGPDAEFRIPHFCSVSIVNYKSRIINSK